MSWPFIIRETTGPSRQILLTGRSLPYQEVNWGGTQRLNNNWFPGNPVATAQVIGQTYKPTRIRGKWKDTFLARGGFSGASLGFKSLPASAENLSTAKIFNFPPIGPAGLPLSESPGVASRAGATFPSGGSVPGTVQLAERARVLRDAFEMIRRSGQLLKVEWGSIARFGFLTDADFIHDREEDIAWELEFTWIGDTDVFPTINLQPSFAPLTKLKAFLKALQDLLDLLTRALLQALFAVAQIQQGIRRIGTLITSLIEVLNKFASLALVPAELIGNLKQQFTSIALAVKDLINTIRSIPAAYASLRDGGNASSANAAAEFAAAIAFNAAKLGVDAVRSRRELDKLEEDALLGLYVSPGGVTLRDVATRYYGDPSRWVDIADFNGFTSSSVPRGTVVRVPRI